MPKTIFCFSLTHSWSPRFLPCSIESQLELNNVTSKYLFSVCVLHEMDKRTVAFSMYMFIGCDKMLGSRVQQMWHLADTCRTKMQKRQRNVENLPIHRAVDWENGPRERVWGELLSTELDCGFHLLRERWCFFPTSSWQKGLLRINPDICSAWWWDCLSGVLLEDVLSEHVLSRRAPCRSEGTPQWGSVGCTGKSRRYGVVRCSQEKKRQCFCQRSWNLKAQQRSLKNLGIHISEGEF